jgi:hypothetical protein
MRRETLLLRTTDLCIFYSRVATSHSQWGEALTVGKKKIRLRKTHFVSAISSILRLR